MRKTKIVCTLGPATDDDAVLAAMIKNGMNVARMNFSHGSHDDHKRRIDKIKSMRKAFDCPLAIMLDTKGPEIRIGTFANGKVFLRPGQKFTLTPADVTGDEYHVSVGFKTLGDVVKKGERLLFSDGLIETEVFEVSGGDVTVMVKNGGYLSNRKSINLPDSTVEMPYMNDADRDDIRFVDRNCHSARNLDRKFSDTRHSLLLRYCQLVTRCRREPRRQRPVCGPRGPSSRRGTSREWRRRDR